MASTSSSRIGPVRVGDWLIEPTSGRVTRGDESVRLEPKVMAVLMDLVAHHGSVRPKADIIGAVWSDAYVGEAALSRCVSELRRVLGDDARNPCYIETLPKRGYRLVAEVSPVAPAAATEPAASERRSVFVRLAAVAALLVVLFAAWWTRRPTPTEALTVHSIAVLPLRALSQDANQQFFAEGLTDQILTQLATLEGVSIRSANGRLQPQGDRELSRIAEELGVDAIIEGSVQRSGEHILINLELLHGRTDFVIWAGSYQEISDDLLEARREVAAQAAREIALALAGADARTGVRMPDDPQALQAYDRGRRLTARGNPADSLRGLEYYREALALVPEFALAHAAIADAQAAMAWHNWMPPELAYGEARASAYRALDLDPRLSEGHAVLAAIAAELNWDWPEAERRFRTAIDLDPASAFARERYARYLRRVGRLEEALEQTTLALEAQPDSLTVQASHAWNLLLAGQLDEAAGTFQRILELDNDLSVAQIGLCAVHNLRGETRAAISSCGRAAALPGHELQRGALGHAYALAGDAERAHAIAAELDALDDPGRMAALAIAVVQVGLGDRQAALESLEAAIDQRVIYVAAVLEDPYLRQLRDEPSFVELLERMLMPGRVDG